MLFAGASVSSLRGRCKLRTPAALCVQAMPSTHANVFDAWFQVAVCVTV
jgi:hypothetical protein